MPTLWSGPGIKQRTVVCGNAVLLMHGLHSIWFPPRTARARNTLSYSGICTDLSCIMVGWLRFVHFHVRWFKTVQFRWPLRQNRQTGKPRETVCQERFYSSFSVTTRVCMMQAFGFCFLFLLSFLFIRFVCHQLFFSFMQKLLPNLVFFCSATNLTIIPPWENLRRAGANTSFFLHVSFTFVSSYHLILVWFQADHLIR